MTSTPPVCATPTSWQLVHLARPGTLNAERASHWSKRATSTAEWRASFWLLAREQKVPHLERISIDVHVESRTRRLPDPGACWPAVKAGVDGLVDAHVLDDDTGAHVAWIRMFAPACTGRDALTLSITHHTNQEEAAL